MLRLLETCEAVPLPAKRPSCIAGAHARTDVALGRRRELWEAFGPSVEVLPEEEVLEAGEHKGSLKIR